MRGQYINGWIRGTAVPGYLDEDGCEMDSSDTETYIAIKTHIDNWRWSGVPFYLRTGKRLPEKVTEIVIQYKSLPHNIFGTGANIPNKLVIDITNLDAGESIRLENLDLPEGVKPAAEDNHAVCMVAAPKRGQLEQQAKKAAAGK